MKDRGHQKLSTALWIEGVDKVGKSVDRFEEGRNLKLLDTKLLIGNNNNQVKEDVY